MFWFLFISFCSFFPNEWQKKRAQNPLKLSNLNVQKTQMQVFNCLWMSAAEIDTVSAEPEWSHSCLNLFDHQSLYIYSSNIGGLSVLLLFFFKQFGIALVFQQHESTSLLPFNHPTIPAPPIGLKERARRAWLIQHETSATWLIPESNCP